MTILLFLYLTFLKTPTYAASCCGGSSVGVPLIVENEKGNLISRYVQSEIERSVNSNGIWSKTSGKDLYRTYKIEGSYAFPALQMNAGIDIVQTQLGEETASGVGDTYIGTAFQILEDDLKWYHPRLFQYFKLTLPTGKSIYEAETPEEARGKGFWTLGTGLYVYKMILPWDFTFQTEVYKSLKESYQREDLGKYTVEPGYGGHFLVGTGYNYKLLRVGSNLDWNIEQGTKLTGSISSEGSSKRFVTWNVSATVLVEDHFDLVFSYFDQTLFGSPTNVELARGISLGLQKKWY